MRENRFYTFIYILIIGIFLSACSISETKPLEPQKPLECPKPLKQEMVSQEKENVINIDKVVMIMPEEEKNRRVVKTQTAPKKKTTTKRKKALAKKPIEKPKKVIEKKPKKTIVTAPKKLIKKKENPKNLEKNIGDRVCRNAKGMMGFMPLDLVGVVQGKKEDTIKVKIIDSRSDNPAYDGIGLYKNTMVLDKFSNWKLCK